MPLAYRVITGTFTDGSGNPVISGNPMFTPSAVVMSGSQAIVTPDVSVQGSIVTGQLKNSQGTPLQLLDTNPSNNPGLTVEGWTGFWFWTVTGLPGQGEEEFSFMMPSGSGALDISALINSPASGGIALPITIAEGGTGQITQQAAIDALAVPGTAGRYLRDTGTHAQLSAIALGDLPDQPYQFRPENYGAKRDGKVITDATIASGSLSTLTSASANFTSGDTGKHVIISGAGASGVPLAATITYVSATSVTLSVAASGADSAAQALVYGIVYFEDLTVGTNYYANENGCPNVKLLDLYQTLGPIASPQAAPANNTAWPNYYYRDAWITLHATTITAVSIDSTAQNGLSGSPASYTFFLPAGHSYTPTYTGTLTHTVTLI